ncbi:MAG: hypothetical protein H6819_01755 [Phycisphaerales bacterium]|nr:hypothetical protein [Phycisphaerales bacterium]MCB9857065.1 hypothetical protein [Phycisphaerales bacterium]MCB9861808.1 hypothetical protein [Phycisphaerales bacterium]
MKPTDEQLADLAKLLGDTADCEIDCAELLDHVAAYLEAVKDRRGLEPRLQQVAQHFKICPECREEFEALIRAEGLDPQKLLGD